MRLNDLKLWAAAALIAIGSASAGAADSVRVPGTRTSLQPPTGFSLADRFPGFQRTDLQSSIMVSEIPAPAADMMRGMTKDGLAKKGMTLISSKTERIDGRAALLLHVAQPAAGKEFLKWMLVTGDRQTTLLVGATFPKTAADQVSAAVRSSVLSASWA